MEANRVPLVSCNVVVHPASCVHQNKSITVKVAFRKISEVRSVLTRILKYASFLLIQRDRILGANEYVSEYDVLFLYLPNLKYANLDDQLPVCISKKNNLPISDNESDVKYAVLSKSSIVLDLFCMRIDYNSTYYLGPKALSSEPLRRKLKAFEVNTIFLPHIRPQGFKLETCESDNIKIPYYLSLRPILKSCPVTLSDRILIVAKRSDTMTGFMLNIRQRVYTYLRSVGFRCDINELRFKLMHGEEHIRSSDKKLSEYPNLKDFTIYVGNRSLKPSQNLTAKELHERMEKNSFRTIQVRGAQGMSVLNGVSRSISLRNYDTVSDLLRFYVERIKWEMLVLPNALNIADSKGKLLSMETYIKDIESLVDVIATN